MEPSTAEEASCYQRDIYEWALRSSRHCGWRLPGDWTGELFGHTSRQQV